MEQQSFNEAYQALHTTMLSQAEHYQPTEFWAEASKEIIGNIQLGGIENFRNLKLPLSFFVPTYGLPGNGLNDSIIDETLAIKDLSPKQIQTLSYWLKGNAQAEADYRVLLASNMGDKANLLKFSESQVGNPVEQFEFDGNCYSRSALNYLLGLSFLNQYTSVTDLKTVAEIGGGFGTLGEILYKSNPEITYLDFDIAPTANVAHYYLEQTFGADKVGSYLDAGSQLETSKPLNVFGAWQIENLEAKVDLFVNFISFQEMEPHVVQNYLNQVNRLETTWVLLRNMREGKQLKKDHQYGVEKPIFSDDYKKMLPNYEFVASNVYPFGLKTVDGFHSELMLFKRK